MGDLQKALRLERKLLERLGNLELLAINGTTENKIRVAQSHAANTRLRLKKLSAKISEMGKEYAELRNYLDMVWELYCFTRQPGHLAAYLKAGGEIDDQVRSEIIERLLKGKPSKKGSPDALRDIAVFEAIRDIRMERTYEMFAIYGELENAGESGDDRKVEERLQGLSPEITLTEALRIYLERKGVAMATDTLRHQYDRGRKLLGLKSEKEKRQAAEVTKRKMEKRKRKSGEQ